MASRMTQKQNLLLEPGGLSVSAGSRVAYLFSGEPERTRFAQFIAWGLLQRDKCVIITDTAGRSSFSKALIALGCDLEEHERNGSLLIITDEIAVESLEAVGGPILEDTRAHYRCLRCINDISSRSGRGWKTNDFLRFEVKGHLLAQHQPCTIICQYDRLAIERRDLSRIIAAHQFIIAGDKAEKNHDRRPLSQVIFDGMDEQLRAFKQLQDLSLRLTASLDLDEAMDAIIDAAITICQADSAAISCIDAAGDLRILRHRGLSEDYLRRRHLSLSDPSVAAVMATREPVIIEDVDTLAGVSPNYEAWKTAGIRSIVTLSLVSEGEVFGMIGAGSRAAHSYSQTETDAMAILAAQASSAITNAKLFDQLRAASRAKDEFLATLSHELRTPLTPILGWMHLLKQFTGSDPLLAQGIETVERNANQLAGLINDLLDLTRIISGKIELVREPVDLNALVSLAVDQIRPQAESRRLSLDVILPVAPVIADVDPVRIQQVLSNLLSNAIKFTPAEGRVSVSLKRVGAVDSAARAGDVVIEVADTGIGINPEFIPHVFDRFAQAHGGINRRYGGLGLGLAITRAMVEMHGGQITAASAGAGTGSRFSVRFPEAMVKAEINHYVGRPEAEQGAVESLGLRLVVIEDSLDTLDMLRLWLESFGCDVLAATEAGEGIKLAAGHHPDLIISDIGMPDVDGYELIRKMRKIPGLENVPAIALTGYAQEEDRELALAAGYTAHMAKPAEMRQLLYLIKKLTGR